jgi:transcriptional regulator with XRE-family HTH domain
MKNIHVVTMRRLKLLRIANNLSQFVVAKKIKVSVGRYNYLERGLLVPTDEEKTALAQYFGVPVSTVFRMVSVPPLSRVGQSEHY